MSTHRLYTATITVRPDASIEVRYFLPSFIYGDDPVTTTVVEPSLPAILGMLLTNDGYGGASDVHVVRGPIHPHSLTQYKHMLFF